MKHSQATGKHGDKQVLPSTSKKKGEYLLGRCSIGSVENALERRTGSDADLLMRRAVLRLA